MIEINSVLRGSRSLPSRFDACRCRTRPERCRCLKSSNAPRKPRLCTITGASGSDKDRRHDQRVQRPSAAHRGARRVQVWRAGFLELLCWIAVTLQLGGQARKSGGFQPLLCVSSRPAARSAAALLPPSQLSAAAVRASVILRHNARRHSRERRQMVFYKKKRWKQCGDTADSEERRYNSGCTVKQAPSRQLLTGEERTNQGNREIAMRPTGTARAGLGCDACAAANVMGWRWGGSVGLMMKWIRGGLEEHPIKF